MRRNVRVNTMPLNDVDVSQDAVLELIYTYSGFGTRWKFLRFGE